MSLDQQPAGALDGRVAVVSGATGSLGSAAARTLAEHGARLALLGSSEERIEALASGLPVAADRVLTWAGDLRQPGAAQRAATAVMERYGRADIVLQLIGGWAGGLVLTGCVTLAELRAAAAPLRRLVGRPQPVAP